MCDNKIKRDIWFPYFKPTEGVHNSGFGMFEVGYLTLDKENKADKVIRLGSTVDDIWLTGMFLEKEDNVRISVDLTTDGYIRLHSFSLIRWNKMTLGALSSVWVEVGDPKEYIEEYQQFRREFLDKEEYEKMESAK